MENKKHTFLYFIAKLICDEDFEMLMIIVEVLYSLILFGGIGETLLFHHTIRKSFIVMMYILVCVYIWKVCILWIDVLIGTIDRFSFDYFMDIVNSRNVVYGKSIYIYEKDDFDFKKKSLRALKYTVWYAIFMFIPIVSEKFYTDCILRIINTMLYKEYNTYVISITKKRPTYKDAKTCSMDFKNFVKIYEATKDYWDVNRSSGLFCYHYSGNYIVSFKSWFDMYRVVKYMALCEQREEKEQENLKKHEVKKAEYENQQEFLESVTRAISERQKLAQKELDDFVKLSKKAGS